MAIRRLLIASIVLNNLQAAIVRTGSSGGFRYYNTRSKFVSVGGGNDDGEHSMLVTVFGWDKGVVKVTLHESFVFNCSAKY